MSPEESQLLKGLFERTKAASATPRDREAETLIADAVRDQPAAPYYLAQAVIVQEKGLEAAAAHIKQLEERIHDCIAQGFAGWNITVPHKQAMLPYLDEMSDEVRATGQRTQHTSRRDRTRISASPDARFAARVGSRRWPAAQNSCIC